MPIVVSVIIRVIYIHMSAIVFSLKANERRYMMTGVVVVFFTLTDRASTIPSNTRGCQSGTWSAGQEKIRGTSTKLQ